MKIKIFKKLIFVLVLVIILLFPSISFARRVKTNPIIIEFLKVKDETINQMVAEIMTSERGEQLVEDIKQGLVEHKDEGEYRLPIEMKGIMVPAGHGFEYKVDIFIGKRDGYISTVIHGDTEPEGDSEDPSCWDRTKVIIRSIVYAIRECDLQIESRLNRNVEDPFWYNYYLNSEHTIPIL
ncbi:MAG: hypothetical protein P9M06_02855 [Candidatus Saelkia tenebricola]|nr:hypothetical protein [Candidatus Saelkia tenebricola]